MTLDLLLAWWNLIFAVPFALGLLYMGLYIATGITLGDGDLDADADADSDVDADVDADLDADVDVDGDIDGDVDADVDSEFDTDAGHGHFDGHGTGTAHTHHSHAGASHHEPSVVGTALALLGVGRVPFSVALMVLVLMWGLIGMIINRLLWPVLPAEWMLPLIAVPLAGVGSAVLTGGIARAMGRLMPLDESTALSKRSMIGRVGEALYDTTETFGMAIIKDDRGERYQVACRTGPGTPTIRKGQAVLLVHHDAERDQYIVRAYDLGEQPSPEADSPISQPAPPHRSAERES